MKRQMKMIARESTERKWKSLFSVCLHCIAVDAAVAENVKANLSRQDEVDSAQWIFWKII